MTRRGDRLVTTALVGGLVVIAGVLALASLYLGLISQAVAGVQREAPLPDYPGRPAPAPAEATSAMNFLILDVDGDDRLLSVLVGHLSAGRDSFQLIALPAELWLPDGQGQRQLGELYQPGDSLQILQAVESLLGTRIEHQIRLRMADFLKVADPLGGVTVSSDSGGATGTLSLDSSSAQDFTSSSATPLVRLERSTMVTTALLQRLADGTILANPMRLEQITRVLTSCLVVDGDLTPEVVRQTALELRLSGSGIGDLALPVRSATGREQGIEPDPTGLASLRQALVRDDLTGFVTAHPHTWEKLRSVGQG